MLDEQIQRKILEFLYNKWLEDFFQGVYIEDAFEGISEEIIVANAEYLVSKGLIEEPRMSRFFTKITVYGIDAVEDIRISLDVQKRTRILEILKEHFGKDPYYYLPGEKLVELTGFAKQDVMRNVWYLEEKGHVAVNWAMGGIHSARITASGIDMLARPSLLESEQRVMAHAYSIFYVLENKLRVFVERKMREAYGNKLWEKVPQDIKTYAEDRKSQEEDSTSNLFQYMLFRHFKDIIGKNWSIFKPTFKETTGIVSKLDELEPIRTKIAHCRLLSSDELVKLELFFKEISQMIAYED